MTRVEHVEWSKKRAWEYLPADPAQAVASMISDLSKHPEMERGTPTFDMLGGLGVIAALEGHAAVGRWIDGFN